MSGRVVSLYGERGIPDPELGTGVALIRSLMRQPYDSNVVVVDPMHPGYLPHVLPNGNIILGEIGVKDFEYRFGSLDINPTELLVVYTAARRGLERRQQREKGFQAALGQLAIDAKAEGQFPKNTHKHGNERRLIGYASTHRALDILSRKLDPKSARERLPAQARAAAEKFASPLPDPVWEKDRAAVVDHFIKTYPFLTDRLFAVINTRYSAA